MDESQQPVPSPAQLPPGTVVGKWRVVAWAGRGVYGAVYRAVRVEREDESLANSVALKMGLLPEEPHFDREVELLSRTRHPSIQRLWDSGEWRHASGAVHPFFVMDWVDGVPLYEWARQHGPFQPAGVPVAGTARGGARGGAFRAVSTGMSKGRTCWSAEPMGARCSRTSARAVTRRPRC